jgi:hypothetical protein
MLDAGAIYKKNADPDGLMDCWCARLNDDSDSESPESRTIGASLPPEIRARIIGVQAIPYHATVSAEASGSSIRLGGRKSARQRRTPHGAQCPGSTICRSFSDPLASSQFIEARERSSWDQP